MKEKIKLWIVKHPHTINFFKTVLMFMVTDLILAMSQQPVNLTQLFTVNIFGTIISSLLKAFQLQLMPQAVATTTTTTSVDQTVTVTPTDIPVTKP